MRGNFMSFLLLLLILLFYIWMFLFSHTGNLMTYFQNKNFNFSFFANSSPREAMELIFLYF